MDQDLVDEIDDRLEDETRSEYIRESVEARMDLEDAGRWENGQPTAAEPVPDGGQ